MLYVILESSCIPLELDYVGSVHNHSRIRSMLRGTLIVSIEIASRNDQRWSEATSCGVASSLVDDVLVSNDVNLSYIISETEMHPSLVGLCRFMTQLFFDPFDASSYAYRLCRGGIAYNQRWSELTSYEIASSLVDDVLVPGHVIRCFATEFYPS
ncbi:hypothetical protein BHE74_00006810 [Ensete ventricosum]|uniref:Uncharacterized protein n=1 Tax=Ensete ventricosum TaxID=4639 RepID=A0A444F4Q1_ENSVE|nr:hypothetical protein GW17_00018461 [Ensete ventricosum]RWW84569.1 hypothetical protein BHE74_00006810 [Ensete ventricosum]RZR71558.1 hypothetical protein BHM03_00005785 [Ensete ventricosum]